MENQELTTKEVKLSIITITFRDPDGLRKTWDSIRQQTWQEWEWIVIDGGSGTEVEHFLQENDANIAYWCSEPDKGIYNAMNKGISKAKGERLLFMNSADTLAADDILEKVYQTPMEADIVYGDALYDRVKKQTYEAYPDELTLDHFMVRSLCHQSSFIRRELLTERGYDEHLRIVADWRRFLEFFLEGRTFQHLPIAVSIYDTAGISTTHLEICDEEREQTLHELFPERILRSIKNSAAIPPKLRKYIQQINERWIYKRVIRSTARLLQLIDALLPKK